MPYSYTVERSCVFTEEGQVMFLRVRDRAALLLKSAGAVRCEELFAGLTGDSWHMLACVDRLVELGELREVGQTERVAGQHRNRIFTRP